MAWRLEPPPTPLLPIMSVTLTVLPPPPDVRVSRVQSLKKHLPTAVRHPSIIVKPAVSARSAQTLQSKSIHRQCDTLTFHLVLLVLLTVVVPVSHYSHPRLFLLLCVRFTIDNLSFLNYTFAARNSPSYRYPAYKELQQKRSIRSYY